MQILFLQALFSRRRIQSYTRTTPRTTSKEPTAAMRVTNLEIQLIEKKAGAIQLLFLPRAKKRYKLDTSYPQY